MASVFDILGTVLSVLSLLGCFSSVYRFLKNRQPFAQAKILEEALREAYKRVDELEQYGYLSEHSNLSSVYVSALARIDRDSLRARAQAKRHRPNSVVAVLVYSCRYGVKCALARRIGASTKMVRDIRHQLDYPLENPYISYSGLVPRTMQYRYDEKGRLYTISRPGIGDEVKSAASNTQLYRSTEGLKFRDMTWNSDPLVDADIASQLFAIRARRMQRIQARLDVIADRYLCARSHEPFRPLLMALSSILRKAETVYGFPSNAIRLNRVLFCFPTPHSQLTAVQLLMIEQGLLPAEDGFGDIKGPSTTTNGPDNSESSGIVWRPSQKTPSGMMVHVVIQETAKEVAQREAARREMDELRKEFESLLEYEFADTKIQSARIAAKTRQRPPGAGASRRTTDDTPTAVMASGISTTSVMRSHQD